MKRSIKIFIFLFFLLNAISQATADTIYLKNGYRMEGIISKERDEYLELEVNSGRVKFYRREIDRAVHSSEEENKALGESWKQENLRKDAELKKRQEEIEAAPKDIEASLQENHLIVDAVLNGKVNAKLLVDTGASFVVLSPAIVQQLDIKLTNANPDLKMSLADGREVPGKLFKLASVNIGEIKATDVETAVIYQENAFKGFDGLLGMSFLKLFKFAISTDKGKLVLERKVDSSSTPR